jgi:enoyl-CoA hydratase
MTTPDYSHYRYILVEKDQGVARVTLNRPSALNAVNGELHQELERLWTDLGDDEEVNVIVLTGAGRAFCAGGDIKGMATGQWAGPRTTLVAPARAKRIVERMLDLEQPVIGAINGDAIGLGATLALLCDISVVSEKARIADTHVRVGVAAGDGGAVLWPLLIGPARAKEFLMRGTALTGAEAARIGLVNYSVAPEAVLDRALELARELAEGPQYAIRWTKVSVNKWLKQQVNLILDASVAYEMLNFTTEDHREAAQAFVEHRKPKFKGA